MKVDGKHTRTIWVEADGATVGTIDQTLLPHRYATIRLETGEDAARAIKTMQVRGAPLIGAVAAYGMALRAAPGCLGRGAGARLCASARHAADRDQSEMGARRDDGGGAQSGARRARRRRLQARAGDRRRGRRDQRRDRPARAEADRGDRRDEEARRAGQCADPLQRRLARDRRLGHRDRRRSIRRTTRACRSMCGSTRRGRAIRAPRSPPGSSAITACAHRDPGQHRRPPDAARRRSTSRSSAPTASPRRATCATRSAPT